MSAVYRPGRSTSTFRSGILLPMGALRPLSILVVIVLSAPQLLGDDTPRSPDPATTPPDWVRPGEPAPPLPEIERHVLRAQARAADPAMQKAALRRFETLVAAGALSRTDHESLAVLAYLATHGTYIGSARNDPLIRIRATAVLGDVGGQAALDLLAEVVGTDTETAVVAEAVRSIGKLRPEPSSRLAVLLAERLKQQNTRAGDPALVIAVLNTVESIHLNSWGFHDPELFLAIIEVYNGPHAANVRNTALRVLDTMRGR